MNYEMHTETITDTETGKNILVRVLETSTQTYSLELPSWLEYGVVDDNDWYDTRGYIVGNFHQLVTVEQFRKGQMFTPEDREEHRLYIHPEFPFVIVRAEKREGIQGPTSRTIIYAENSVLIGKTWTGEKQDKPSSDMFLTE